MGLPAAPLAPGWPLPCRAPATRRNVGMQVLHLGPPRSNFIPIPIQLEFKHRAKKGCDGCIPLEGVELLPHSYPTVYDYTTWGVLRPPGAGGRTTSGRRPQPHAPNKHESSPWRGLSPRGAVDCCGFSVCWRRRARLARRLQVVNVPAQQRACIGGAPAPSPAKHQDPPDPLQHKHEPRYVGPP